MKRFFLFLILAVALASCATSRKVHEATTTTTIESSSVQESEKHETVTVIDTTRTEHGKVIITEIVFDTTPAPVDDNGARASPGSVQEDAPVVKNPSGNNAAVLDLANIGTISGNVKSIRQTILEADIEQKGVVNENAVQENSKSNANATFAEESTDKSSAPAPDPYRWRYIFYLAIVALVALLYLKRAPIINWIKRILSGLRRIF